MTALPFGNIIKPFWLTVLSVVGVLIMGISCDPSDSHAVTAEDAKKDAALESAQAVSAREIQREYEANEVAADLKYKDKRLKVTARVSEISKDAFDEIYLNLVGTQEFFTPMAYFDKSDLQAIAALKKGQEITFMATCDGFLMSQVQFKKCKLVN